MGDHKLKISFGHDDTQLKPLLESGILLTTIITVILNAFFNGAEATASLPQAEAAH